MKVFVVDANHKPILPCHPAIARQLLSAGKAAVLRAQPFTIILKREVEDEPRALRLKLDPGSKVTGIALVDEECKRVVFAAELTHRGAKIKSDLEARKAQRSARRQRKTRYRKPRFMNRRSAIREGLKAPSLLHRVFTIETWVRRLRKFAPVGSISMELVKFDTQAMVNAEISGVEYQQGELAGYEVREYLLEKWQRACAYCGVTSVPLQIEHIQPKSKGGSNRVSNLTLACEPCNSKKSDRPAKDFLKSKPTVLAKIISLAQAPLKDAAAVNATRCKLFETLKETGLPLECGTGGRTKFNRKRNGHAKAHWLDAANVGASTPEGLQADRVAPLMIKAMGHGTRQMCNADKFGFQRTSPKFGSSIRGFRTGDLVCAKVMTGKYRGVYFVRLSKIDTRGSCGISAKGLKFSTNFKNLIHRQRADGFSYACGKNIKNRRASRERSSSGILWKR